MYLNLFTETCIHVNHITSLWEMYLCVFSVLSYNKGTYQLAFTTSAGK